MTKLNDRKSTESLVKTVSGLSPDGNGDVGLGHQTLNDRDTPNAHPASAIATYDGSAFDY